MTIRIRLRRDTAAGWTTANPVLGLGEAGVETDTHKLKVGDGVTDWATLAYYSGGGAVDSVAGLTGTISASALRGALYSGTQDNTTVARGDGTYANWVGGAWGVGGADPDSGGSTLWVTGTPRNVGGYAMGVSNSQIADASVTVGQDAHFTRLDVTDGVNVPYIEGHYVTAFASGTGTCDVLYGFYIDGDHGTNGAFAYVAAIDAGAGRWNFYAPGTADNFFAGSVFIGSTANSGYNFSVQKPLTGAVTSYAIRHQCVAQSDVTSGAVGYYSNIGTAAASFTCSTVTHYDTAQGAFGAGSTVSTQFGFRVSATLVGAATNYGFHSSIPSGANRWNFYAAGTAANFFAGSTAFGTATIDASALANFVSTSQGVLFPRMTTTQRDAISSPTPGLVIYNTSTGKLNVRGAAGWEAITSA